MGLFSSISSAFKSVVSNVTRVVEDVAPIAIPLAIGAFTGGLGAAIIPQLLGGLTQPPASAGGVAQATFARTGGCPVPGTLGNPNPFANPQARAAFFPGFNTGALPARPMFGALQTIRAQFPQPTFPQTTSFNQQAFGGSVAPQFRPFVPSFRSGRPGFSGQFQPGISTGFNPQFAQFPQQQQFAQPRFAQQQFQPPSFAQRFGGFGGFGF